MPPREADLARIGERVAAYASSDLRIQAAYVFGSVAKGCAGDRSDVDVALLLDPTEQTGRLDVRLDAIADLGARLGRDDVDVVILNDASALLAHRVLSEGRLVFDRSPSARVRFQVRTAQRYLDMVPVYETYIRYSKQTPEDRVGG